MEGCLEFIKLYAVWIISILIWGFFLSLFNGTDGPLGLVLFFLGAIVLRRLTIWR